MIVKFGGFYPPPDEYKDDPIYITTGILDGWYYPTKEEMKIYLEHIDEVLYGKTK